MSHQQQTPQGEVSLEALESSALFSYNIDPLALNSRDHTHLKFINILSPNKHNFRRNDVS